MDVVNDPGDRLQQVILDNLDMLGILDVDRPEGAIPTMPANADVLPLHDLRALLTLYTRWVEYFTVSYMAQRSALAQTKSTAKQALADARIRYRAISPRDVRDAEIALDDAVMEATDAFAATEAVAQSTHEMRIRLGAGRSSLNAIITSRIADGTQGGVTRKESVYNAKTGPARRHAGRAPTTRKLPR